MAIKYFRLRGCSLEKQEEGAVCKLLSGLLQRKQQVGYFCYSNDCWNMTFVLWICKLSKNVESKFCFSASQMRKRKVETFTHRFGKRFNIFVYYSVGRVM